MKKYLRPSPTDLAYEGVWPQLIADLLWRTLAVPLAYKGVCPLFSIAKYVKPVGPGLKILSALKITMIYIYLNFPYIKAN